MSGKTIVKRDNDRDIKFTYEKIGSVSSSDNNVRSDYSGTTGRWAELTLYRTTGGKYVCEQIGRTRWQGEHDRYTGAICETDEQVIEFFGAGWLAKELYEEAGIECIKEVN